MTSSRRLAFAAIVSVVGVACATATSPLTGGGSTGVGDGGGSVDGSSPGYGGGDTDSGTPPRPRPDSGSPPPIDDDSGTPPPPVDSGPPVGTGLDCTGTESDQIGERYSTVCDNWYENGGPAENCTVGGGQCGTDPSGNGFTMCCYKPSSSSYCYEDFGGKPQCVPQ